jgi:hypothetical protein
VETRAAHTHGELLELKTFHVVIMRRKNCAFFFETHRWTDEARKEVHEEKKNLQARLERRSLLMFIE